MRIKRFSVFAMMALIGGLMVTGTAATQGLPDMITITTFGVGSSGHTVVAAAGEVLQERLATKVRVVPIESEQARVQLLRSGGAHSAYLPGNALYNLQFGLRDYSKADWGPLPLQLAWMGPSYLAPITTQKQKDINTVADIKGKRVTVLQRKSSFILAQGMLAFAGLTWDDVIKVPVPGYTAQFKALIDGTVDVALYGNPLTSTLYELEASPKGIKWLPLPKEDKEGWKRLRQVSPEGVFGSLSLGAGIKDKAVDGFVHAYAFAVYDTQSTDLVYAITKTIVENHEKLASSTKVWQLNTLEFALRTPDGFPHAYHPGAVKYFKEKGLWTPEHEEWNRQQLEMQRKVGEAWKAILKEASAQKWTPEELQKRWHQRHKELTGYEVI